MALSTFMGVETALRGILAQQEALDVTGHNIANANTEGYTRQRVELTPFDPFANAGVDAPTLGGIVGGGVDATAITRVRDDYLDNQYRSQTMKSGRDGALADGLQQVDQALAEPSDSGLSSLFSQFWSAWQDVANDPQSTAARQALLQNGAALADGITQLYDQVTTFETQNGSNETSTVDEVNADLTTIGDLNAKIAAYYAPYPDGTTPPDPPNDLLDTRDRLVDEVVNLTGASVTANADHTVSLTVGGSVTLVDAAAAYTASFDTTTKLLSSTKDANTATPTLGKLGGLVDFETKLEGYAASLNGIAKQLMDEVNGAQANGYDLEQPAQAGAKFFDATGGAEASDLHVAITDPKLVAASKTGAPGDGENAIDTAALRQLAGGADSLYQTFVTTVGTDTQAAQRAGDASTTLLQSISNRRLSVSGVSLDEEMTNLLRFQRGYQASARALTAMDDMIQTLITQTGRVGL